MANLLNTVHFSIGTVSENNGLWEPCVSISDSEEFIDITLRVREIPEFIELLEKAKEDSITSFILSNKWGESPNGKSN